MARRRALRSMLSTSEGEKEVEGVKSTDGGAREVEASESARLSGEGAAAGSDDPDGADSAAGWCSSWLPLSQR